MGKRTRGQVAKTGQSPPAQRARSQSQPVPKNGPKNRNRANSTAPKPVAKPVRKQQKLGDKPKGIVYFLGKYSLEVTHREH